MADGNTITRNLPSEILLFQILPKLPVKALPNFMCVCKKWHSFLKSSVFANAYNNHHQNHPKHLVLSTQKPYKFRSIDCESPKDGLTAIRPVPFRLPNYHYLVPEKITILTSLHGLLCVGILDVEHCQKYSDFILWNPLTGGYKTLSKKGCDGKECYEKVYQGIFGLYYMSSHDDYRLLRVTSPDSNIYIYSLKSDSWRNVESTEDFKQRASNWALHGSFREQPSHIFLNEKLYLLKQVDRSATFIQSYSIMRFDTMTEKFTEIEIPSFDNQMTSCLGFMVLRGCIHFCFAVLYEKENYMTNRRCYEMIELWRMDGDGDWTKVLTYGPMSDLIWGRSLLHFMGDGNLLIKLHGDVYILDSDKYTKEMVFKCEDIDYKHYIPGIRIYNETIPAIGKYIETTLSPNQYDYAGQNRMWSKYNFDWCTYRSWEKHEAYERAMIEKYGEDVTKHPGDDADLWVQSFGGRKKANISGTGSSHLHFPVTNTPSYRHFVSYVEYAHTQQQVPDLQIQIEMERKERKEMQDQIAREREIERKARDEMQTQITEFIRLFGRHPKNPPNSSF